MNWRRLINRNGMGRARRRLRSRALLTVGACGLLIMAACSSADSGGAKAPNPVDLLKKIPGCELPPGAKIGDRPLPNVRSASCVIPDRDGDTTDGNQVEAYTYPDKETRDRDIQIQGGVSDDGTKLIAGDRFLIVVTGTLSMTSGGTDFFMPPAVIASDVDGSLL